MANSRIAAKTRSPIIERELSLLDRAPGLIAILSGPDHVFEFANQAYVRLARGRALIGRPMREALPELEGRGFFESLDGVYASGARSASGRVALRVRERRDAPAEERFFDFLYEPLFDEAGRVEGIFIEGHDVTAAQRAEDGLKKTQRLQAAMIELSDRLRELDDPTDISYAAAEILGRTLDVSRVGYASIDPAAETITIERDWNAPGIETLARVMRFREYGAYIENLKRGEAGVVADVDKDPRTLRAAASLKALNAQALVNLPIREQGGLVAMLYLNNATAREWPPDEMEFIREAAERTRMAVERRRAEHQLRDLAAGLEKQVIERTAALTASEARLRTIFESSYVYQGLLSLDGVLLEVNDVALSAVNVTAEEVVGQKFWETPWFAATPGLKETIREGVARAAAGETVRSEIRSNLPAFGWRWFDFTLRPQVNAAGEVTALVPEGVDITDRRQAEEALRQSQKLESMGQLTGGVAHDFNNLLTPIIGSLDMLQRHGVAGEREKRLIEAALASAERAKTLVQRLLAFARRQPLQPRPVDVGALVTGMADLVASTTGPQIKVSVEITPDLPAARSDPNQLELAILNLSVNARDAMPDGGVLRLSAALENIGKQHRSGLAAGAYIRLSVADTGVGMDEKVLPRAIEPFFSTKGIGKGTGLGLSMVHGFALQLGGALTISSRPGLGTNVELWLPVSEEPALAEAGVLAAQHEMAPVGVVLLVDDENFVRMSTAEMLRELGYEVREACSAEEALSVFNTCAIDLLVTDHLMPGLSGVDLARIVRDKHPELPVLIISGFADADGLAPDLPRLTKPFRQSELAARIGALRAN